MSVIVDLHTLQGNTDGVGVVTPRVLWNLAGGRRATSTARIAMLACDSTRSPILLDGDTIVAAGDAHTIISTAMRTALVARDQGCRFPGCTSPAVHADAHHIIFREQGGPTELANLVLLCRPCHRLVHRHGWRLRMDPDGTLTVRRGRYRAVSRPPLTPPPPATPTPKNRARAGPKPDTTDPPPARPRSPTEPMGVDAPSPADPWAATHPVNLGTTAVLTTGPLAEPAI